MARSVMYTRHTTQKRKAWHDGTLETKGCTTMLLDDSGHTIATHYGAPLRWHPSDGLTADFEGFLVEGTHRRCGPVPPASPRESVFRPERDLHQPRAPPLTSEPILPSLMIEGGFGALPTAEDILRRLTKRRREDEEDAVVTAACLMPILPLQAAGGRQGSAPWSVGQKGHIGQRGEARDMGGQRALPAAWSSGTSAQGTMAHIPTVASLPPPRLGIHQTHDGVSFPTEHSITGTSQPLLRSTEEILQKLLKKK